MNSSVPPSNTNNSNNSNRWIEILSSIGSRTFILVLVIIAGSLFYPLTQGYFYGDDFAQLSQVKHMASGDWALLWQNFTSPPWSGKVLLVWRPLLVVSFLIDFLIWKSNAFGYLLTNLLFYICEVVLLFWIVEKLTFSWSNSISRLTAFFSALLFAVNPLHCESVAWYSGALDSKCCLFFLLSILLALKSRISNSKLLMVGSVLFFWVAILIKEMAIGLPIIMLTIGFLNLEKEKTCRLIERVRDSLRFSMPFLISIPIYFLCRFLAIGTVVGGYTAGKGQELAQSLISRWTDPGNYIRILFPFDHSLYSGLEQTFLSGILLACYIVCFGLILLKSRKEAVLPWLILFAVWIITATAPLFQLWRLNHYLGCSRYVFFLTIPLSMVLPILMFRPSTKSTKLSKADFGKKFLVGVSSLFVLAGSLALMSIRTNGKWISAGQETKNLLASCKLLSSKNNIENPIPLLNLPAHKDNIPMLFNSFAFVRLLKPPFVKSSIVEHFATFYPSNYSRFDDINADYLKSVVRSFNSAYVMIWDKEKPGFKKVEFEAQKKPGAIKPLVLSDSEHSTFIDELKPKTVDFELDINPLNYDFIEVEYKKTFKTNWASWLIKWQDNYWVATRNTKTARIPDEPVMTWTKKRIKLSRDWHWYDGPRIKKIKIGTLTNSPVEIRQIKLIPSDQLAPLLTSPQQRSAYQGSCYIGNGQDLKVVVKALQNKYNYSTCVEVSKPDFDLSAFSYAQEDAVAHQIELDGLDGEVTITNDLFPVQAVYHIRAFYRDKAGKMVGEYAEPILVMAVK